MRALFLAICGKSKPGRATQPLMRAVLLVLALFATPSYAGAASSDDAIRAFVEQVNVASTSFFASGSEADAKQRCRDLLAASFDVPAMGKEVLGKAWDKASEDDRKQFLDAFEDEIVSGYLRRMRPQGTTMTFIGVRPPVGEDRLAASRRSVPGKEDQTWIWWLRADGQSWRVVDVLLDGHSALNSEAQEYSNVLQSNNGDMGALIAFMRKRAATP